MNRLIMIGLTVLLIVGGGWIFLKSDQGIKGNQVVATRTVVGGDGKEVTIPALPKRVVIISSAGLDLYVAAGGESAIIGRAESPNLPEECKKKIEKAEYDRQYRLKNLESLKIKKAEYFQRTYDPVTAKAKRKQRMHRHVEYCRTPKYRAYKQKYDQIYRAKKQYGEFYESALLLNELETEVTERLDFTERAALKGTLNKRQTRKRNYEQSINC